MAVTIDRLLLEAAHSGGLPASAPHACNYLPEQTAVIEGLSVPYVRADTYQALMDLNFRRSGTFLYRARCPECSACVQIRIPVDRFRPTRSQRRAWRRNQDLVVRTAPPQLSREKVEVYRRYLESQHPQSRQGGTEDDLRLFLYSSCVDTWEIEYRIGTGSLAAVSIVDVSPQSMSSVYHFFDPAHSRRSLGVFSVQWEIALCRQLGIPHYYLGYWVAGCSTMDYKARYGPHEILVRGSWTQREADNND
jgi:arginine-tRNA-protein transferase